MGKKKRTIENEQGNLVKSVKDLFRQNPKSSFNYKQVAGRLGIVDRSGKDLLRNIIGQLFVSEELIMGKRGKYQINIQSPEFTRELKTKVVGTVDMKQTGKAYVIPEDHSEDILISATNTYHALHGDKVVVFLFPKRKGHKLEGQIIEIIRRSKRQFVGTLEISKNFAFLAGKYITYYSIYVIILTRMYSFVTHVLI